MGDGCCPALRIRLGGESSAVDLVAQAGGVPAHRWPRGKTKGTKRMSTQNLLTARSAASEIREALLRANEALALQVATQFSYSLHRAEGGELDSCVSEPGSTGDVRYDTLIAVLVRFALGKRGITPPAWTEAVRPLAGEWMPGYDDHDVLPRLRELIRADSPAEFIEAGILARRRAFEMWS